VVGSASKAPWMAMVSGFMSANVVSRIKSVYIERPGQSCYGSQFP